MNSFEAELLEVISRAPNISSFRLSNPIALDYKAGQYFFITVKKGEAMLTHHFSFSSSPTEKGYFEFTTILRNTSFKNSLRKLEVGDNVSIKAPFGEFILDKKTSKISMLSGGIGIAPLRSIIKYCTDKQLEIDIILLYGNISKQRIVFYDDLSTIQKENPRVKIVYTLDEADENWKGYTGYIDAKMVRNEIPDYKERILYTCGPPAMIKSIETLLLNLGIRKNKLKKEKFSGY